MALNETLQEKIKDIALAVAGGLPVPPPPDSAWTEEQWREWVNQRYNNAMAILNMIRADAALKNAAASLAAAHAAAAAVLVEQPTAADIEQLKIQLQAVSKAVGKDQAFHAALDIFEKLAAAASKQA